MEVINVLFWTVVGTLLATFLALLPALHVYNVSGIIIIAWGLASWRLGAFFGFLILLGAGGMAIYLTFIRK